MIGTVRTNNEIYVTIVGPIIINVVDDGSRRERLTEHTLSDQNVLAHVSIRPRAGVIAPEDEYVPTPYNPATAPAMVPGATVTPINDK